MKYNNKFVIIIFSLLIFNCQNTYSFILENITEKNYKYVITANFYLNNNNSIKKITEGNIQPKSQDVIEIKLTYPNIFFTLNETYVATMGTIQLNNKQHFKIIQHDGKPPFIVLEKNPPYAPIIFQSKPLRSRETDELPNILKIETDLLTNLLTKMLENCNEKEIINLEEVIRKLLKNPNILKKVKKVINLIEEEIKNNTNSLEKEEKCDYRSTGVIGKLVGSVFNFKTLVVAAIIYLFCKVNPEILYQILGPPAGPRPS